MDLARNNVTIAGDDDRPPMVFVHGFGCDQTMWSQVAPAFADRFRVVSYDLTGMGGSDLSAYDFARYADLSAHADDLIGICETLGLTGATLVGHSVGATIAMLAANRRPGTVAQMVLVSPSPSFLSDDGDDYDGGFSQEELEGLVAMLEENHMGWSMQMAPTIAGQPAGGPASDALTRSFCRTDPDIAAHFGQVTFLSDNRTDMQAASRPSLILHCSDDALVPMQVADWMRAHVPGADIKVLNATGHCPHMTVPEDVVSAMRVYLRVA